jgi:hypothetical protein
LWLQRSLVQRGRIGGLYRSSNKVNRGGALRVLTIRARGVISLIVGSSLTIGSESIRGIGLIVLGTRLIRVLVRTSSVVVELVLLLLVIRKEPVTDRED